MQYAIVQGSVIATAKTASLKGLPLKVLVPCDAEQKPIGEPIVAIDAVGARFGDHVIWVGKREASLAIPGSPLANDYPVDAAVTGIVDDIG